MYSVKVIHPDNKRNDTEQFRFAIYDFCKSSKPLAVFLTVRAANAFLKLLNGETISESEAVSADKQISLYEKMLIVDDFVQKKHEKRGAPS